jgi:hypothetical protein
MSLEYKEEEEEEKKEEEEEEQSGLERVSGTTARSYSRVGTRGSGVSLKSFFRAPARQCTEYA